ncbi:hypothetical protein JL09_g5937 [Pichia kudriavzevii]|uniref:Uncharacterized protein n=1 Tax=Pichia kudriavzevii TaxID=4909 RepID=A0A099NSD4_PICKU|nr:hypothetical protein JL09_g5937 [Pichia kudriavzevii]
MLILKAVTINYYFPLYPQLFATGNKFADMAPDSSLDS